MEKWSAQVSSLLIAINVIKKYCIPCVKVVVEAVTGDSAAFDDLVPVVVVDDVVLEVDSSRTVVS